MSPFLDFGTFAATVLLKGMSVGKCRLLAMAIRQELRFKLCHGLHPGVRKVYLKCKCRIRKLTPKSSPKIFYYAYLLLAIEKNPKSFDCDAI